VELAPQLLVFVAVVVAAVVQLVALAQFAAVVSVFLAVARCSPFIMLKLLILIVLWHS
jgi:hypothetical protein